MIYDSEILIKNKNDFYNFKNEYKSKKFNSIKLKFICSNCHEETIKTLRTTTDELLCRKCTTKHNMLQKYGVENISQLDWVKTKKENTCLNHYGTTTYLKTEDSKTKNIENCIKKYGTQYYLQSVEGKEHYIKTCQQKYGVNNVSQIDSIKEKRQRTCTKLYGHKFYSQTEEYNIKKQQTYMKHFGSSSYTQSNTYKEFIYKKLNLRLKPYNMEYINREDGYIFVKCKDCNKINKFKFAAFYQNMRTYKTNFCTFCNVNTTGKSLKEQEVFKFILENYKNNIVLNDRLVLNGKELDIYLPDLKLAFEFDGTYWHADPRFYSSNDKIHEKYASIIWEQDKEKEILCQNSGITLYRILEYDWDNNKEVVKKNILNNIKIQHQL